MLTKSHYIILVLALMAFSGNASAASFDCGKAKTPIELAICRNSKLGMADETMATAYSDTLASLNDAWKSKIIRDQRRWVSDMAREYKKYDTEAGSNEKRKELDEWLMQKYSSRIKFLREVREREKIIYVVNSPETKDVCGNVLNKAAMIWRGRNDVGMDDFTIKKLSGDFSQPRWNKLKDISLNSHSRFDFLNNGKDTDVYVNSVYTSHFEATRYIVAADGEKQLIEDRLGDSEQESNLIKDLVVEFPKGTDRSRLFPVANESTKPHPNPKLASRLLDTSATNLYGGWYTRSYIVRYKNTTYIIAESVNNGGGPTFAIFKPQPPGNLKSVCYYRATPSLVLESIKNFGTQFRCPVTQDNIRDVQDRIKTDLDNHPCGENFAQIEIKDWGGSRPVRQESEIVGRYTCSQRTFMVGNVGDIDVKNNLWQPLNDIENGNISLFITKYGAYISIYTEDSHLYYRITNNSLQAVCSVNREVLDPPGYQHHSPDN